MENGEETKECKPENSSSPRLEQRQAIHVYPEWAAMQAYYGPRMAVPPYFNPAVASGHMPPPYMWGPLQHMMPPYAAIYPHGGVYATPAVPLAASPMHMDSPTKSSANSGRVLVKKPKGFDGLAMSVGDGGGNKDGFSHSEETKGSSEGSDGNTAEGGENVRKRSRQDSPSIPEGAKTEKSAKANKATKKGAVVSAAAITAELELKISPANANTTSSAVTVVPDSALFENDRELKRERRKQSNRESARRSRLRKQAEAQGLGTKVESLTAENSTLKSEINRLTVNSEKLKLQNAILMERLKYAQPDKKDPSLGTANLLSQVDESNHLRQLLDAVAAG